MEEQRRQQSERGERIIQENYQKSQKKKKHSASKKLTAFLRSVAKKNFNKKTSKNIKLTMKNKLPSHLQRAVYNLSKKGGGHNHYGGMGCGSHEYKNPKKFGKTKKAKRKRKY